ncbi:MAG: type I-E CRISPR-associated protein Cse1/CasA [Lachnospiraceae bacterium]|nr:type I-E CRISPR-associated protein Cse1/CasA [Lachnospiraceae bacterium]
MDEKWIMVLREDTGQTEKVSLKEVFAHAGDYYDLAGEMKTQDFAVLRVLLAVLQTVFSRFDSEGIPYDFLEINENTFQQLEPVDRDDLPDEDPYFETWLNLWEKGKFPEIVQNYLEAWRDHFYLFDDKYPFYQVTPEEMKELVEKNSKGEYGTLIYGKNINRTISESGNKITLFSPIIDATKTKGIKNNLKNDQLVRWLIMYQGYSGTADKAKVRKREATEATYSKGWLYDLGGIYLKGHNLFETLMLNCILSSDIDLKLDKMKVQIPSWERSPLENIDIYFRNMVDNRASLYTNWSRAISFDKDFQDGMQFHCFVAKLPEINHIENFMEPMTCWKWMEENKNKKNIKHKYIPRRHNPNEAVWRHFNVLMGIGEEENKPCRQPGIISWYDSICENSSMRKLQRFKMAICTVSMRDDGNSNSWVPVDEIIDEIQMETAVLIDNNKNGWVELINTLVDNTRSRIEKTLVPFVRQISTIRGYDNKDYHFVEQERERLYLEIDQSFRDWLYEIKGTDSMNDKALEWYRLLKEAIQNRGTELFRNTSFKDLKGIQQKDKEFTNIATAYNKFKRNIAVQFKFLQEGGK